MAASDRTNPRRVKSSESLYSLREFLSEFPDDDACLEYLWRERHSPDGEHAHCPKCDRERVFRRYTKAKVRRQSWTCTGCGLHVHPTAGTIFEKSSRPLTDWFYVMYLVSSSRCGVAAKQVERELGCNYKTAWRMLNRVRDELMSQDGASPLSGEVEADETFIGGKPRESYRREVARKGWNMQTAYWDKKAIVFAAVERGGRIRAEVIPDSRARTLDAKVREFIIPASILYTDDFKAYRKIGAKGYTHRRINHSARIYAQGDVHTQTIEGFFGHFKNDVRGTHHAISHKWLQSYVNEWVWKWNHRRDDEAMFRQLLSRAAGTA